MKDPAAKIAFGNEVDPEDLGLPQDIHPDDLTRGSLAPLNFQQLYRDKGAVRPEYYVGPDNFVRFRSSDIRPNPNPLGGVISSLRAGGYWGPWNPWANLDRLQGPP
jgi:hypothetical protein